MTVKFKVGFTMSAETLFGIIAKFLPVEDLQVEEVPPAEPFPTKVPKIGKIGKVARLVHAGQAPKAFPGGKGTGVPDLEHGVNRLLMEALKDGEPRRYSDLKAQVRAGGYSASGIGSRLQRLRQHGVLVRVSPGLWRLAEPHLKKTA